MKPLKAYLLLAALAAVLSVASVGAARADVIVSPTAIIHNDFGDTPFPSSPQANMINQSNVTPFTSGVTNFAAYVASNPTAGCNDCAGQYSGAPGVAGGNIDFDLGSQYRINALGLFNGSSRGMLRVAVYTSTAADFSTETLAGNFFPSVFGDPIGNVQIQVLNLVPTTAEFVRLNITSFAQPDSCHCLGVSEVTFGVAPAPGPTPGAGSAGLAALALAGFYARARRA
jgi:hypothetical protein